MKDQRCPVKNVLFVASHHGVTPKAGFSLFVAVDASAKRDHLPHTIFIQALLGYSDAGTIRITLVSSCLDSSSVPGAALRCDDQFWPARFDSLLGANTMIVFHLKNISLEANYLANRWSMETCGNFKPAPAMCTRCLLENRSPCIRRRFIHEQVQVEFLDRRRSQVRTPLYLGWLSVPLEMKIFSKHV